MYHIDADEAIGYVNKLIDNVRCSTCNKLEGTRVRYQCGHTACNDCVIYTQDCQTCTSPSQRSDSVPKYDKPLTQTVKNAVDLLEACHNFFDANAFQRKRLSEQLRIEKELFPKCIQAPAKYENKRKSSLNTKENRYSKFFPGEEVSTCRNMENASNYVQKWLSRNETNMARKPFSDLNVNTPWINSPKSEVLKQNVDLTTPLAINRKRTHFKSTDKSKNRNIKDTNCSDSPKRAKKQSTSFVDNKNSHKKCDNDESGIFMDNDPIIIYDSQETVLDKDKNAWLAVLEAGHNETSTSLDNLSQDDCTNDSNKQLINSITIADKHISATKVPFFKRSAIIETCNYCKSESNTKNPVKSQLNPVKITIDGDSFLTTITVFKNIDNNFVRSAKNTVSVQTNTCVCEVASKSIDDKQTISCIAKDLTLDLPVNTCDDDIQSEDLFAADKKIYGGIDHSKEVNKCIVIQESDSDSDIEFSGPISVKVDCHRSCTESEYGILNEILNVKKHESKQHHRPRGPSPTSTNSSEKENYNPNKMKRSVTGKKKKYTKSDKNCFVE